MLTPAQSKAIRRAVFFATLMVVMRHGQNLHLYYENGSVWMPAVDWNIFFQKFVSRFTDSAIPFFFMLSGFLYFLGVEKFSQLREKNLRRVHTLLVPYLLWNGLELVFWGGLSLIPVLHDQMVHSFGVSWNLKWILEKLTVEPINGQFWYIRTLIIFCILSPVFLMIYRHKIISLMCFGILMSYWEFIDCSIFSTEGLVCFFLGGLIGYHKWHKKLAYHKGMWLLLLFLSCILTVGTVLQITFPGAWYLRIFLTVSFLFQFSLWCEKSGFMCKISERFSNKTFFIYAIHGNALAAMSVLLSTMLPHTPAISCLMYFICVSTIIAGASFAAWLLQKAVPDIYSLLTGRRGNIIEKNDSMKGIH